MAQEVKQRRRWAFQVERAGTSGKGNGSRVAERPREAAGSWKEEQERLERKSRAEMREQQRLNAKWEREDDARREAREDADLAAEQEERAQRKLRLRGILERERDAFDTDAKRRPKSRRRRYTASQFRSNDDLHEERDEDN